LGITAIEMAKGKPPFADLPVNQALFEITTIKEEIKLEGQFSS
jgi:hypothetical protein